VNIDMGSDFVDDTVHGDTNRTFAALFTNFNASVSGLYNSGLVGAAASSAHIISCALNATTAAWSIYIGGSANYFASSAGYVSVDSVTAPYDEFSEFNFTIRPSGAVSHYAGA